ncbi:hypothetical protein HNR46_001580 [Haloferula luteola]|uniref:Uncharacterized protein n=1 Tax=Haloferula luteola TaxID=595692 RepID=A0A840V6W4_9BACT|nr:hypothetical protein [Haloferula luteola]MBB5351344.1 hypothetical protein [Haloferula luteola]
MRESDWRVVWDPDGESPWVILDFGDLMPEELAQSLAQTVTVGRFDLAPTGKPAGGGNRIKRLKIGKVTEHGSSAEVLHGWCSAIAADPWGAKKLLKVMPREGAARWFRAALETSDHQVIEFQRTQHTWDFRIGIGLVQAGDGVTIIGGYYNPPTDETPNGTITIEIPSGSGPGGNDYNPGDKVQITGVAGINDGVYTVGGTGNGGAGGQSLEVDADHDEPPVETYEVSGGGQSGTHTVTGAYKIHFVGCSGGAYSYRVQGGAWQSLGSLDANGDGQVTGARSLSFVIYQNWWYSTNTPPVLDPLVIASGNSYANGGPEGSNCTCTVDVGVTVELRKDGEIIDSHQVVIANRASKTYAGGSSNTTTARAGMVLFTLLGAGVEGTDEERDSQRYPTGAPKTISGGTASPMVDA